MAFNVPKKAWLSLGVPFLVLLLVKACMPERAQLYKAEHEPGVGDRKLIIVPGDNFPDLFLAALKNRLEEQHKFGVAVAVQMAVPVHAKIEATGQYDVGIIAEAGAQVCGRVSLHNEYCVILVNRDINVPSSGLRFVFARHYKGISVVSVARMNSMNFGGKIDLVSVGVAADAVLERSIKMINKGLGLGYYNYALSANRNSVMYAPIMSLRDLDAIGNWYLKDEVEVDNYGINNKWSSSGKSNMRLNFVE